MITDGRSMTENGDHLRPSMLDSLHIVTLDTTDEY